MDARESMVSIAATQIGYREGENNNNQYGVWYGANHQPWCAMFISWCAARAGLLGADNHSGIIPRTAWVPDYYAYFSSLGRYQPRDAYQPQAGDIILFGSYAHAGIVESCDGQRVVTIEGNTSANGNSSNGDGVYRRRRNLTDSWIRGYGLPDYAAAAAAAGPGELIVEADGEPVAVSAVNLDGENYVRLRDFAKLAPVTIGYDAERRMPLVNTLPCAAGQEAIRNWLQEQLNALDAG